MEMTNLRWIKNQIRNAETAEDLEQVLVDIKCDQFENEPYTQTPETMAVLRQLFNKKKESIDAQDDAADR